MVRQTTFSLRSCPPRSRSDAMISRTLFEVVPELASINAVELVLSVSKQLAQPRVVKQQPAILIHDQQRSRTELQDFAKLALVLGGLSAGRRR